MAVSLKHDGTDGTDGTSFLAVQADGTQKYDGTDGTRVSR